MFWLIVAAVVALLLAVAWRTDRRRRGARQGPVAAPENNRAVGEAKVEVNRRNLGGMGPNRP